MVFLLQLIILCIILNCKDCSVVSLRYGLRKISGHSSSDIRPGVTDCHFCMPDGFTYLFLMNWLYNIFVAAFTSAVGIPLKLTSGTLTFVVTALFLINWRQLKGRLCLICRALRKLHWCRTFPWFRYGPKIPKMIILIANNNDNGRVLVQVMECNHTGLTGLWRMLQLGPTWLTLKGF